MNNLQMRLEVQGAIQQWVASFMQEYNVPAWMMEDALNKVLIVLKDQTVTDLLTAAAQDQLAQQMEGEPPQEQEQIMPDNPQNVVNPIRKVSQANGAITYNGRFGAEAKDIEVNGNSSIVDENRTYA